MMFRFFILIFFLASCLKTKEQTSPKAKEASEKTKTKEKTSVRPSFYIVSSANDAGEKPAFDPNDLHIIRATIALVQLGNQKIGRLQAFADPEADFLRWILCPKKGSDACIENKSFLSDVFLGTVPAGSYSLTLRACVRSDKTSDQTERCGPLYNLDFTGPTNEPNNDLVSELFRKEKRLKELGQMLYQVLQEFSLDLKKCQNFSKEHYKNLSDEKIKEYEQVEQIIQIQIENIKNLGPEIVSYWLQGSSDVKTDTSVMAAAGFDDNTVNVKNEDPFGNSSYIPSGFSLTQTDVNALDPTLYSYQGGNSLITPEDPKTYLKASVGSPGSLSSQSYWSGLSDWKKATVAASCLLGGLGGLAGLDAAGDFAGFRLISGFLNLKRDDYPCFAFEKAISSMEPLKKEILETKKQLSDIQNRLSTR